MFSIELGLVVIVGLLSTVTRALRDALHKYTTTTTTTTTSVVIVGLLSTVTRALQ